MSSLVIDIEVVGAPEFEIPPSLIEKWEARAQPDAEPWQDRTALHALSSRIVSCSAFNPETRRGQVHMLADVSGEFEERGGLFTMVGHAEERSLLDAVWEMIVRYGQTVTFNGRGYDVPMLCQRSVIQRSLIRADLTMPFWKSRRHFDVCDILGFGGRWEHRYSLAAWCEAVGIPSPKADVHGADVASLYAAGEYLKIARYNAGDTVTTGDLAEIVKTVMP